MNVLVCGSRDIEDKSVVYEALANAPWEPDVLVHGDAVGVDKIADRYARVHSIDRDVHEIPEWVWQKVGPRAGPMRNAYMIEQANAVIAVWDGDSTGTKDAMQQAESEGLPVYKVVCDGREDEWEITRETLIEDDQMCLQDFE
jgi:hypothetical protein